MVTTLPSAYAPAQMQGFEGKSEAKNPTSGRVLVVDDDEILSRFLDRILRSEGYAVEVAHNGPAAVKGLHSALDLVILDLNLPQMDGLAVLEQLRAQYPTLPVMVLTGRSRSESAVVALERGADDCLCKPFSYLELLARVKVLRRRHGGAAGGRSQCADLLLNRDEVRVTRNGVTVELTSREYELLEYLMRSPRIPVSRSVLLKEIWGGDEKASTNIVDVYMKYVRDKVDLPGLPRLIRTVRGLGYAVSEEVQCA